MSLYYSLYFSIFEIFNNNNIDENDKGNTVQNGSELVILNTVSSNFAFKILKDRRKMKCQFQQFKLGQTNKLTLEPGKMGLC